MTHPRDRAKATTESLRATVKALRAAGEAADPSLWRDNLLIHVFRRGNGAILPDGRLGFSGTPLGLAPGGARPRV